MYEIDYLRSLYESVKKEKETILMSKMTRQLDEKKSEILDLKPVFETDLLE